MRRRKLLSVSAEGFFLAYQMSVIHSSIAVFKIKKEEFIVWKKADIPTSAQRLQQEGYSRLTALVIANAGVENKEQAEEFLHS